MHILITGGTGLIGQALVKQLLDSHHHITLLTRNIARAKQLFDHKTIEFIDNLHQYNDLNHFDAVVNLAGEPIFDRRWTEQQKQRLFDSRVDLTKQLAKLINQSTNKPQVFISGSAIGYYGDTGMQPTIETSSAGNGFPSQLCIAWEQVALQAETRVCLLRTSMVLASQGGVLKKMLPAYRLGLGGKIGSGQQYWAWIHIQDMINVIEFLLENDHCHGAFNLCAPQPCMNLEFNRTLAKQLKRPAWFSVPKIVLTTILGERACLLLDNQYIFPEKLQQYGFEFRYNELSIAINECLSN